MLNNFEHLISFKNNKNKVKIYGNLTNFYYILFELQADRFIDRKLDKAENMLNRGEKKAKKWYSRLIGDENGPRINDLHIFVTAFVGGVVLGVATAA